MLFPISSIALFARRLLRPSSAGTLDCSSSGAVNDAACVLPARSTMAPFIVLHHLVDCIPAPTPSTFTGFCIGRAVPGLQPAARDALSCR
eukprot:1984691-Amphidinium_carterae.1